MSALLDPDRIRLASRTIDPEFLATPFYRSLGVGSAVGARVWLKDETATPIGSFKGRGVSWWMHEHPEAREIVCASAGNFGQAVAWCGTRSGRTVTVYASRNANPEKVAAMRGFGAQVILEGDDFDAAKDAARTAATRSGRFFLEDGAAPEIAEGAGTIALECTEFVEFDTAFIPVGNGALAGGMGSWLRHALPHTRIIGVCASGASAMERSWRIRTPVSTNVADTIADGIAVRIPVPESLPPLYEALDDILVVDDADIVEAMRLLRDEETLVTEPAGAVGLAGALLAGRTGMLSEGDTLLPICGRNIDERYRATWLG